MNEELCCIELKGKTYVGTYEDCCAVADEIYRKTRIVIGIKKYNPKNKWIMEQTIIDNYGYNMYLDWLDAQDAIETEFTDNLELILN